jgi:DNA-binding transcriptional MerR regulator
VKIGQVAKSAGVTASAIRFYEAAGLLPKPERKNGVRTYGAEAVERIRILKFFRSAGIPVRALAPVLSGDDLGAAQSTAAVRRRIADLDRIIEEARAMQARLHELLECTCAGNRQRCVIFKTAV